MKYILFAEKKLKIFLEQKKVEDIVNFNFCQFLEENN